MITFFYIILKQIQIHKLSFLLILLLFVNCKDKKFSNDVFSIELSSDYVVDSIEGIPFSEFNTKKINKGNQFSDFYKKYANPIAELINKKDSHEKMYEIAYIKKERKNNYGILLFNYFYPKNDSIQSSKQIVDIKLNEMFVYNDRALISFEKTTKIRDTIINNKKMSYLFYKTLQLYPDKSEKNMMLGVTEIDNEFYPFSFVFNNETKEIDKVELNNLFNVYETINYK